MQSSLPPSRKAVLDALMTAGKPQSLDDLYTAGVAGLSRTGIYRQLQGMVEEGVVERHGARQDARYVPREHMRFAWSLKLGRYWRMLEWTAEPPMDVRFPLASRLPDSAGRQTLIRFLEEIQAQKLDQPWQLLDEEFKQGVFTEDVKGLSAEGKTEFHRWIRNPSSHGSITIIAFGSCARGTARRDSDLDLLVVTPESGAGGPNVRTIEGKEVRLPPMPFNILLTDLAFDLEHRVSRPIDLKVIEQDEMSALPPGLLQALVREGMTVHANRQSSDWVETWQEQMKNPGASRL